MIIMIGYMIHDPTTTGRAHQATCIIWAMEINSRRKRILFSLTDETLEEWQKRREVRNYICRLVSTIYMCTLINMLSMIVCDHR